MPTAPSSSTRRTRRPGAPPSTSTASTSRTRARLLRPQRALLGRGVPLRRPAPGRDPRHPRRLRRRTSCARSARRCATGRAASGTCTWCSRTRPTAPPGSARDARRRAARRARRSGTTTSTTRRTCCSPARPTATTPTMPRRPAGALRARAGRGLRLPGPAIGLSRRRGARRAERAPAAGRLRVVPADPRPGRQPRLRRAHRHARPTRRCCDAAYACLLLSPHVADALHGRGVRRVDAVPATSATSAASSPRPCRRAGARSSARFAASPTRRCAQRIPDPNAASTFEASKLRWDERGDGAARRAPGAGRASCWRCAAAHLVPHLSGAMRAGTLAACEGGAAAGRLARSATACALAPGRQLRQPRRRSSRPLPGGEVVHAQGIDGRAGVRAGASPGAASASRSRRHPHA